MGDVGDVEVKRISWESVSDVPLKSRMRAFLLSTFRGELRERAEISRFLDNSSRNLLTLPVFRID
jgi:hypothetical protein